LQAHGFSSRRGGGEENLARKIFGGEAGPISLRGEIISRCFLVFFRDTALPRRKKEGPTAAVVVENDSAGAKGPQRGEEQLAWPAKKTPLTPKLFHWLFERKGGEGDA